MSAVVLAIALSAQPSFLRLGADERATIRVACEGQPAISASVGRIESLRRTGGGMWEGSYVPPDEALPQVAILLAVSAEGAASLAIPLWGEGDAVVKTRPRGRISVEIGNQTFGPVVADEHGDAAVPVVVAPGVQEARHGKRSIPLHVPASRTIHLALGSAQPAADRAQTIAVYVAATTPQGEPRRGAAIRLSTTRGDLSALHEREPGLYEGWLALVPGRPGEVRVTAALDDAAAFVAEAKIALGGGVARRIEISADRERIGAGDPRATLRVQARDAADNAPGEALQFETSAGAVVPTATGPGEWRLDLTLPPSFEGRRSVQVRAHGANASATRELVLVPGPLRSVGFDQTTASVRADGESRLRLRVQLQDAYGNPVDDVRPEVSADQGDARLEEQEGTLYATYQPPPLRMRGETTLSLRAGQLVGRAQVRLLPEAGSKALTAKAGILSNFSGFATPLLGVEAALRTDRFGPQLAFALEADYGHRAQTEMVAAGTTQVLADSRLDLLLVHLSAAWRRPFAERNTLFFAAGPSAAAYWTRVGASAFGSRRGFAIAPGLQALLGIERRMRWVTPFAEARFAWIASPDLPMLTGSLRAISLMAGVRLETL